MGLPQEEERRLEEYAIERVERLRSLSSISAETRSRIEPVVSGAARNAHMRENRVSTFREFQSEHRWFRWISNVAVALLFYWLVFWWSLSLPLKEIPQADQSNAMFVTAVTLFILFFVARRLLSRREGYSGKIHVAASIFCFTLALAATREWWIEQVLKVTAIPAVQAWQPGARPIADMAGSAMLERSSTALLRIATLILIYQVGRAIVMAGQTAKSMEYASATLLNSVLEIAAQLETLVCRLDREPAGPPGRDGVTAHSYLWLPDRENVIRLLETTARFAEGYWGKTARVSDHVVNVEMQRVAEGIAAAVRRWKRAAAVGGAINLKEMRDAFSIAVVNCADGDWDLLASEVSAREVLSKRLMKLLRRVLALAVLIAAILAVLVRPFFWTQGLSSPAAAAPFMVAAAFVAGILDPTIYDRMTPVTKLGSDLIPKR
ncbi:hypothetical protein ACWC9R_20080 [Streptomyces sp. NPDC001219]